MTEPEGVVADGQLPTVEEQLTTATDKADSLSKELEVAKKGLKTTQASLREREATLNRQGNLESEIASLKDTMEILTVSFAERQGKSREDIEAGVGGVNIKAQIASIQQKHRRDAQIKEYQATVKGYQERVEALGLKPGDDEYLSILNLVRTGYNDPAVREALDARLDKLEGAKKLETPSSVEEQAKKLAEEMYRQKLEETGALKPESATPSGASLGIPTKLETFRKWITDLPIEEYAKLRPEIERMQAEGRIK